MAAMMRKSAVTNLLRLLNQNIVPVTTSATSAPRDWLPKAAIACQQHAAGQRRLDRGGALLQVQVAHQRNRHHQSQRQLVVAANEGAG
jgi:hypothetical protein